jgi:hypothetical protein
MRKSIVTRAVLAGALVCAVATPALGRDSDRNTTASPQERPERAREQDDDPRKFFWFHREGVSAEAARNDIEYCLAQSSGIRAERNRTSGTGGLIGVLVESAINGIIEGIETRRMRYAGVRMCMGLYGYSRFLVPEPEWEAMMRADDAVDRLVAFSSGPLPTTERLSR